jgi:hypothetical protein
MLVVALTGLWGVSWASAAKVHEFYVSYSGTGSYAVKTEASVACGLESRDETTHFSWATSYVVKLKFGAHGFCEANDTYQPGQKPL